MPSSAVEGLKTMSQRVGVAALICFMASMPAMLAGKPAALANGQVLEDAVACEPGYELFDLSPRELPRRFRGDWESADAVIFAFTGHWPEVLAELVATSLEQTRVVLLVDPAIVAAGELDLWMQEHQIQPDAVEVVQTAINTPWIRDYGPLQTYGADGRPIWLDAGYGMDRPDDDMAPRVMAEVLRTAHEGLDIGLEGGALISNGEGLCASTIEYFADNALDLEDEALRDYLMDRLGCSSFVLMPALSTDKARHVDMFAQFLAPKVVAVGAVDPRDSEEDAARMDRAAEGLVAAARTVGIDLTLVRVPLPVLANGDYRTYLNALRVGGTLLVPSYADVAEEVEIAAYTVLSSAISEVAIVPVPSDDMIRLGGALHCIGIGVSIADGSGTAPPTGRRRS